MKSFMSDRLKEAVECGGSCGGNAPVRSAGQESAVAQPPQAQEPAAQPEKPASEVGNAQEKVIVMSGPLGAAMTTALNDVYSRQLVSDLNVAQESLTTAVTQHVYANGMIQDQEEFLGHVRKSVGVIPNHGSQPTVINTMLDAISRVHDIDFMFVHNAMTDTSAPINESDSTVHVVGTDGMDVTPNLNNAALENYEVEAVRMVIKVRPKTRN